MAEPEKKEYMKAVKLDASQIQQYVRKPEFLSKPEPAYREVVEGLLPEMAKMWRNPVAKIGISCCIEGCCVSWCCVQIS